MNIYICVYIVNISLNICNCIPPWWTFVFVFIFVNIYLIDLVCRLIHCCTNEILLLYIYYQLFFNNFLIPPFLVWFQFLMFYQLHKLDGVGSREFLFCLPGTQVFKFTGVNTLNSVTRGHPIKGFGLQLLHFEPRTDKTRSYQKVTIEMG